MDFDNHFTVRASLQSVWDVMLNAEEVAPCVPGAQITETIDETHFRGVVKIKLGAVQITYRGELELAADETTRTIVLHGKGTETRGSGGASGTFTTVLSAADTGATDVDIHSHVDVTGAVAQFGRSIMQDVANRLIRDFTFCLEQKLQVNAVPLLNDVTELGREIGAPSSTAQSIDAVPDASPGVAPRAVQTVAPGVPPSELRLRNLVVDVLRSRAAATLHAIAERVEPK